MDAYEATRVVFSRVQALDPENAAKIMGLLLIQDHGDKEMIRLAFGPETLLQSVILKAQKDLGLQVHQPTVSSSTSSSPANPSVAAAPGSTPSPLFLSRQNSTTRILQPSPLAVSSPTSWTPPLAFSRSNSAASAVLNVSLDEIQCSDELIGTGNLNPSSFYNGAGDLNDELQLQDQLCFLNDPSAGVSSKTGVSDFFYSEIDCRSPSASVGADGLLLPYSTGWGASGQHRHSCSATDACLGSEAGAGFGWKPCLYFARGFCKNGASCRFVHGLSNETAAAAVTAGAKMDAVVEQQCQELLLRSKSSRVAGGGMSQLMASAFPYTPTGSLPQSPSASSKCLNFLLQQQQNESQRAAAAAAAAAALMLGGEDGHKFMGRSRLERSDFNPGSRQIYLTFPADSTFREEDVSNYFSIYGPVHDVRIPYQQKRMFGFVTFVYPETVKLILAKGNPHFVCDARVLVKPYKEKGKVPDKKLQQAERGDFSGCTTPTGMDSRDPFDLQQIGARMLYNGSSTQELLLRRRLEEQQQALKLQQAIELQSRRFMGLQLLDLKSRSLSSSAPDPINSPTTIITPTTLAGNGSMSSSSPEDSPPGEKSPIAAAQPPVQKVSCHGFLHRTAFNAANKEESACKANPNEDIDFQESAEHHNLPDSPFASPTKSSVALEAFAADEADRAASNGTATNNSNGHLISSALLPPTSTLDMSSLKSCFFQVPRFSGHGAIGM